MKLRNIFNLLIIATATLIISCNDNLDKLGLSIQPENDRVIVGTDTIPLSSSTVEIESVYSRTKYPILGEYKDPVFGTVRSDYIGEFYFPEIMKFKDGAIIDSVRLTVEYMSIIGDSLSPMQLAVYKVDKTLPKGDKHTNFEPEDYSDMTAPLGIEIFTGKNSTYRTETIYDNNIAQEIKIYEINTPLPLEIGESFLDEYKKDGHGALKNTETFREFFPGVYVTTNYGNSTILNVNLTSLRVYYNYLDKKGSSQNTDTIRTEEWKIYITPEVTQKNRVISKNENILKPNDNGTYIKGPAGVSTEIIFPIESISSDLTKSALNQARFVIHTVPFEDERIKLNPPENLLLINRDSVEQFFENGKLHDNITSFIASYNNNTKSYSFGNISSLINHYSNKKEPLNQTYQLIPVDITYASSQGYTEITDIYNQMKPTATMISKKPEKLRLEIIYSSF